MKAWAEPAGGGVPAEGPGGLPRAPDVPMLVSGVWPFRSRGPALPDPAWRDEVGASEQLSVCLNCKGIDEGLPGILFLSRSLLPLSQSWETGTYLKCLSGLESVIKLCRQALPLSPITSRRTDIRGSLSEQKPCDWAPAHDCSRLTEGWRTKRPGSRMVSCVGSEGRLAGLLRQVLPTPLRSSVSCGGRLPSARTHSQQLSGQASIMGRRRWWPRSRSLGAVVPVPVAIACICTGLTACL